MVYLVPDGQTLAGHDVGANLFGTNNYPPIPHITKNQVFIHTSYFLLQLLYVKANTLECTANATVYRKAFISASICFLRHRSQTWRHQGLFQFTAQIFKSIFIYRSCKLINNNFLNRFWNLKLMCTVVARAFCCCYGVKWIISVFSNFRPLILNGMSLFERIFHPLDNQFYNLH